MQGQAISGVKYAAWYLWDSLEFAGEVAADFLGLNDSQYQYIVDEYKRREEKVRKPTRIRTLTRRCMHALPQLASPIACG
eukprot:SAG22_NODE_547_length_9252_cov_27.855894_6_plen_80_part_00